MAAQRVWTMPGETVALGLTLALAWALAMNVTRASAGHWERQESYVWVEDGGEVRGFADGEVREVHGPRAFVGGEVREVHEVRELVDAPASQVQVIPAGAHFTDDDNVGDHRRAVLAKRRALGQAR